MFVGSDQTAAGGGEREGSEWPRSVCNTGVRAKAHTGNRNRKISVPTGDDGGAQGNAFPFGKCVSPLATGFLAPARKSAKNRYREALS